MSKYNQEFTNSVSLDPDELSFKTFFHLILLLFSDDIKGIRFVKCQEGASARFSFRYRWFLLLSVLAQKLLKLFSRPLQIFGLLVEMYLNRSSVGFQDSFGMLVLDLIQGKVEKPENSPTFMSVIGHLDKRVEMDPSITPQDGRYYPALTMMASKTAYENKAFVQTLVEEHWKMEFLGAYDLWNEFQEKDTTQAFLFRDRTGGTDTIVVAFRGTEAFDADAWSTDVDLSWYELGKVGRIHRGFMRALGLQKDDSLGWPKEIPENLRAQRPAYYFIREKLRELLREDNETEFIVTGHSLGGALAILFPAVLIFHEETLLLNRLKGVYTFGQPRVGDGRFGRFMERHLKNHRIPYYRVVYSNDMVPRLPYDNQDLMFKHFGTCVFFNSFYQGRLVREMPNKNYFTLWGSVFYVINAAWELIRSFIIQFKYGGDYKEDDVLKLWRVLGLIAPGVTAHGPQDYVNSTRLGDPSLFLTL